VLGAAGTSFARKAVHSERRLFNFQRWNGYNSVRRNAAWIYHRLCGISRRFFALLVKIHTVAGVLLKGIGTAHHGGIFKHKKRPSALHCTQPKVRKAL